MNHQPSSPSFAAILQDFFCHYLIDQRNLSTETIASYRDTFRLLLNFVHDYRNIEPAKLVLSDLNASLVLEFLRYL
jgi:integrase/recombinase XerD